MCFLWAWRIGMTCIVAFRRPGRRGRQCARVRGRKRRRPRRALSRTRNRNAVTSRVVASGSRLSSSTTSTITSSLLAARYRCSGGAYSTKRLGYLPLLCPDRTSSVNACGPTGGPVYLHDDHEELETNHSLLRVRAEKGRGFSQKHTRRDPCCLVLEDHQVSEGQEDVLPEAYKDERIRRDSSSHPRATRNSISKGLFSQVYFH